MTPDESATIAKIGHDVIRNFAAIINSTILMTIYTYLVVKAGLLLLCKARRRKLVSILTMTAILVMYAITLVLKTLDMVDFIMEVKITLLDNPDMQLQEKYARWLHFLFKIADAEDALYSYMSLLGDAIIIWRVYALAPPDKKWIAIIPCAVLVGSIAATFMLTYCVAKLGTSIVNGTFQSPEFCRNVQTVTYGMAFGTTTIATGLIGLLTWTYRKSIRPLLRNRDEDADGGMISVGRIQVERILMLLLETGILYFFFFAIQLIASTPAVHAWVHARSGLVFVFGIYSFACSALIGIYPTAIIVLSHSKHAILDPAAVASTASTFQAASGYSSSVTNTHHGNSFIDHTITFRPGQDGFKGSNTTTVGIVERKDDDIGLSRIGSSKSMLDSDTAVKFMKFTSVSPGEAV